MTHLNGATRSRLMVTLCRLGAVSILLASFASVLISDAKKVIALRTLSQISFMLVLLSLSLSVICFLHFMVHTSFKASLFMFLGILLLLTHHVRTFAHSL